MDKIGSYICYCIVHIDCLWKLSPGGEEGFGPYEPRYTWVEFILRITGWMQEIY